MLNKNIMNMRLRTDVVKVAECVFVLVLDVVIGFSSELLFRAEDGRFLGEDGFLQDAIAHGKTTKKNKSKGVYRRTAM